MSDSASVSAGIAGRYATAIFELARENKAFDALETGVANLTAALGASSDLRALIASPIISRADQGGAILAVGKKLGLGDMLNNSLCLMAQKRRLFVLPQLLKQLSELIASHKGEVVAQVISATPLTTAQHAKLSKTLAARLGCEVNIDASVDESLIGGLIVKVGSKMIDTSISSKLGALQNMMKEVG